MRTLIALTMALVAFGQVHAQSKLLDAIELLDPALSKQVLASTKLGDCNFPPGDPRNIACKIPNGIGASLQAVAVADNSQLVFTDPISSSTCDATFQDTTQPFVRLRPDGTVTDSWRFHTDTCTSCGSGTCFFQNASSMVYWFDPINGVLFIYENTRIENSSGGAIWNEQSRVAISGFPKLFDTLLTYVPGNSISLRLPTNPDGFQSADAFQVWTGNVRSMPDWSQATPLTCSAAPHPAPGDLVTVPDDLPDPEVGQARYYISASQSGPDRRLGRQFMSGVFSARNPASLPQCTLPVVASRRD